MHEARYLWAIHVVHHCSERYNLSTALRQPVADSFGTFVPYGALCYLGVRPSLIEQARGVNLLYQFWIHTDLIAKLGRFEELFNTAVAPPGPPRPQPALHRPEPRLASSSSGTGCSAPSSGRMSRAGRLRPDQEHPHRTTR